MKDVLCPNCLKTNEIDNKDCFNCDSKLLLNDKYYLIKLLGENSGKTYLGAKQLPIQTGLQRENPPQQTQVCYPSKEGNEPFESVIIKELSIKKMNKWKEEELFQRERIALLNLEHDFIPDFIEKFDTKEGKRLNYYTVIKYIKGDKKNKKYTEEKTISYITKLADILDYIHSMTPPVIHRDIKLSNVIIKDDDIYLIDFGSVTDIVKEEGGSTIAGTFGYMAPEQFLGKAYPSTDYYALGILALVMLTGFEPEAFLCDNHNVNWEILIISEKMKKIISQLLIYDHKKRVKNKKELLDLINLPSKEEKYDIVYLLEFYNTIKLEYKNQFKWKWMFKLIISVLAITLFQFAKEMAVIIVIFSMMLYSAITANETKKFISKFMKNEFDNDKKELEAVVFETFIKNLNNKELEKYYFHNYDNFTNKSIDFNLLLKYSKDLKKDDFLNKHIRNHEENGQNYINTLKEKLKN